MFSLFCMSLRFGTLFVLLWKSVKHNDKHDGKMNKVIRIQGEQLIDFPPLNQYSSIDVVKYLMSSFIIHLIRLHANVVQNTVHLDFEMDIGCVEHTK